MCSEALCFSWGLNVLARLGCKGLCGPSPSQYGMYYHTVLLPTHSRPHPISPTPHLLSIVKLALHNTACRRKGRVVTAHDVDCALPGDTNASGKRMDTSAWLLGNTARGAGAVQQALPSRALCRAPICMEGAHGLLARQPHCH